ncbi:hypothetical protein BAE44_0005014 [Dichanthelium oligosanthes]|uniref:DUF295 domain-containing protein n=1 Tax=Dichanthelium oligosanthes TaxID=888268 RepID=A0A1E5W967_9POAL|nr:hypothetical protein BAE44_0005014 [Dichanthelium oligosanthes]
MVSLLSASDPNVVYGVDARGMDFAKQEGREVDDIGGRAFLLSPWYFGASRSAAECGLEPMVFNVEDGTKRLMVFNVEDGTTRMQEHDEAPVSEQALWMLPTYP